MIEGEKRYVLDENDRPLFFIVDSIIGFTHDKNLPFKIEKGLIHEREIVKTTKDNFILRSGYYTEGYRKDILNKYYLFNSMEEVLEELDETCPLERILLQRFGVIEERSIAV